MGGFIILVLSLLASAFGMENVNDVTYHRIKSILEGHLEKNPGLLDSSKDKDIVVFLGDTGSGKSTVINYLSGKGLRADDFNNIVLENPNDASAMVIGEGADSETFLPRFIPVGDLLFYDLPGFKDTRGTANSLVNACFIKSIIENARSTRLIFVVGEEQINEGRGDSFKKLSKQLKQLIPNKSIENFSGLIITRSYVSKDVLPAFLGSKLPLAHPDLSMINHWIDHQKIDQVSMPRDGQINYDNRGIILNLIRDMGYERIGNIDVGTVYNASQQMEIKSIYDAEIDDIIEKLIAKAHLTPLCDYTTVSKGTLENQKHYIINDFNSHLSLALEKSLLIELLRPVSADIYQSAWHTKSQDLIIRTQSILASLNEEIAKKEKQEEEVRRIQAEKDRQAEETRRIKAEEEAAAATKAAQAAQAQKEAAAFAAFTKLVEDGDLSGVCWRW